MPGTQLPTLIQVKTYLLLCNFAFILVSWGSWLKRHLTDDLPLFFYIDWASPCLHTIIVDWIKDAWAIKIVVLHDRSYILALLRCRWPAYQAVLVEEGWLEGGPCVVPGLLQTILVSLKTTFIRLSWRWGSGEGGSFGSVEFGRSHSNGFRQWANGALGRRLDWSIKTNVAVVFIEL